MQPHILFPILVLAFGMGTFLTTFVGDVSSENEIETSSKKVFLTKTEALKIEQEERERADISLKKDDNWLQSFQDSKVEEYHYPVKEVSIHLPVYQPKKEKVFSISTEYLEPYQNFCVNQVLNKTKQIRYKIVEKGDKIKFHITSPSKQSIDFVKNELKLYDIRSISN
jgi:hypothetical protein